MPCDQRRGGAAPEAREAVGCGEGCFLPRKPLTGERIAHSHTAPTLQPRADLTGEAGFGRAADPEGCVR